LKKLFKYLLSFVLIVSIILLFLLGGYYLWEKNKKSSWEESKETLWENTKDGLWDMEEVEESDISFTLNGLNKTVSLSDFEGKVVLVYFGFTHCPDVCPTSLYLMSNTVKKLKDKEKLDVVPIFISVDPDRDTTKILNKYVKYFNERLIGLTADKRIIDEVIEKYNASYSMVPMENSVLKYTVSHTVRIYMIDRKGILRYSIDKDNQNVYYMLGKIRELLTLK
jgi:cytochrome oxidase Cu insertion factor (SCO1/SenC/PrrC family)